jgi:membrane protease YdiL (CAAX protease family)
MNMTHIKTDTDEQYSLAKILSIWAAVAVPMPIMAFWIAPAVADRLNATPLLLIWFFMIAGMVWQFLLSVWLLHRELDTFTWAAIRERIWLRKPSDPRTGKSSYKLFWWLIPAFGFYAAIELTPVVDIIGRLILLPFPWLAELPEMDLHDLGNGEFVGAWWLMGVAVLNCVFNYLLGEELLFRGVLLPKMRGVFGKWDWVANSALFALYHLHRPVQMLGFIFGGLAWSFPSRYFRSNWFAIILHGLEAIPLLLGVFAIVSGSTL